MGSSFEKFASDISLDQARAVMIFGNGQGEPFQCTKCGAADHPGRWSNGADLADKQLCFACYFWQWQADHGAVVVNGHHYQVGPETDLPSRLRGYAGRRFKIRFFDDGRVVETTNLWHQGEVPETHRDQLPDNAEFLEPEHLRGSAP